TAVALAICTLSLHDALPILIAAAEKERGGAFTEQAGLRAAMKDLESRLEGLRRRNAEIDRFCQQRREMFDWQPVAECELPETLEDRKSTRLNSSHVKISYAV